MTEENVIGHINIKVNESDVEYDSEFSLPEIIFWLETVKSMVIKRVIEDNAG